MMIDDEGSTTPRGVLMEHAEALRVSADRNNSDADEMEKKAKRYRLRAASFIERARAAEAAAELLTQTVGPTNVI